MDVYINLSVVLFDNIYYLHSLRISPSTSPKPRRGNSIEDKSPNNNFPFLSNASKSSPHLMSHMNNNHISSPREDDPTAIGNNNSLLLLGLSSNEGYQSSVEKRLVLAERGTNIE